jgi:hypothetical protein
MTFDFQIELFKMISSENLSKEGKREFKRCLTLMKRSNESYYDIIRTQSEALTQQWIPKNF